MPKPPIDHFGLIAPWFERFIRSRATERLLEILAPEPGMPVLDVGGGTGRIAESLLIAGATIVLLDPSPGMLQIARDKQLPWRLCQGVAESLPFANESFARVLTVDSFHHFWEHRRAAQELVRVLSPGGRLIIEEPDIRRWPVKLMAAAETLMLMRSRFYSPQALRALFETLPDTRVTIIEEANGCNVWVTVTKI